ncbi:hypothetical protein [Streptomyces sp. IBSNAI001]|uniref:hypothetical protein n=1 Tax=Streptomyces sp. IBSNAI001 TaxID=3457499 RepID=UPI003FCF13EA
MYVLTGPRSTTEQTGSLMELAGLTGLPLLHHSEGGLIDATTLYRAPGWDSCPLALADVAIADAYGLLIKDL